jgi:hypothetical protein
LELDVAKLGQTKMNKKEIDLQLDWYRSRGDKLVPIKKKIPNKPEMLEELIKATNRFNALNASMDVDMSTN